MRQTSVSSIRAQLEPQTAARLESVEVFDVIDSTNSHLLESPAPTVGRARLAVAGHQLQGRGRRGRAWHTTPGGSLCLSLSWTFARSPDTLPALTLALGVAASRALSRRGVDGIRLKWPNDIVVDDAKLGGLLVETLARGDGPVTVVTGVGINLALEQDVLEASASSWANRATDLRSVTGLEPDRDALAAALCAEFIAVLLDFGEGSLQPVLEEWRSRDWLAGRNLTVSTRDDAVSGIGDGIDPDGALRLATADGTRRITSGTVSISAQS